MAFDEYTRAVVAFYNKRKAASVLPDRLARSTPARLKKECYTACNDRFQNRYDGKALHDFFEVAGDKKEYLRAIDGCDNDKFKPLDNFLKGKTTRTEDHNIEMLAFLIGFDQRPYEYGRRYPLDNTKVEEDRKPGTSTNDQEKINHTPDAYKAMLPDQPDSLPKPTKSSDKHHKNMRKRRAAALAIVLAAVLGSLGYILLRRSPDQCMYWSFDRFEKASCNDTLPGRMLVALDKARLDLRLITKPDTITYRSIGYVWYLKKDKELDYFTKGGMHPVHLGDPLKPLTTRIIDTHIIKRRLRID